MEYVQAARELGQLLAQRGIGLVFGGGRVGLMGEIASSVMDNGGEVTGVIPKHLEYQGLNHPDAADMRVVGSMHERKALMAELSDGFIAMPGGLGTFEEIFEALTWTQLGLHKKPCGLLNVNGYYDKLLEFLDHTVSEHFVAVEYRQMIMVDEQAHGLLEKLEHFQLPTVDKILMAIHQTDDHEES